MDARHEHWVKLCAAASWSLAWPRPFARESGSPTWSALPPAKNAFRFTIDGGDNVSRRSTVFGVEFVEELQELEPCEPIAGSLLQKRGHTTLASDPAHGSDGLGIKRRCDSLHPDFILEFLLASKISRTQPSTKLS